MKTINININDQNIETSQVLTVNGTVKVIECEFTFNDYWDGFPSKTAIFKNNNMRDSYEVAIVNSKCVVPFEALRREGIVKVAIKGTNTNGQTERTETVHVIHQVKTLQGGANAIEPTPDQYAQYVEEVGEAITEYFDEHKSEFKGDPGDDYILTDADKQEISSLTVEELKPIIDGKMEFYKLDTEVNGTVVTFYHDGEQLDFEAISDKYFDNKYFVYAECLNLTFIPCFPPTETDQAIEFISTYIYGGEVMVDRLIINSNNEGKFEEKYIAEKSEITDLRESLTQKADDNEVVHLYEEFLTDEQKARFKTNISASRITDTVLNRTWTKSTFNNYATQGRQEDWTVGNRDKFVIGDIITLKAVLTDLDNMVGYILIQIVGFPNSSNVITGKTLFATTQNYTLPYKEPQFELIESITVENGTTQISRSAEPNGTPYNFKKVIVDCEFITSGNLVHSTCNANYDTQSYMACTSNILQFNRTLHFIENGVCFTRYHESCTTNRGQAGRIQERGWLPPFIDSITSIVVATNGAFATGTVIRIYGVRA